MTNPFIIAELMPSARNILAYGHIEPGENVTIFADALIPLELVQALLAACTEKNTNPVVVFSKPAGGEWREGVEPPRSYKTALYGSDLAIQLKSVETQTFPRVQETAMIEHGVRMVRVPMATSLELYTSEFALFPYELMHVITRKVYDLWTKGGTTPGSKIKTVRVSFGGGSELTATYDPRYVIHTGFLLPRLMPGQWNQFCGATVGIEHFHSADGTIVFDGLHGEEEYRHFPPIGSDMVHPLSQPIIWRFKGRECEIEGGPEAEIMKRIIARGGPFAKILCEIAIGINPKAAMTIIPVRRAGVTHFAVGSTPGRAPTPDAEYAPVHTHGHNTKANLWIDNEQCIVDGRLLALSDPDVQAVAAKYGSASELLSEVPY